MNEHQDKLVKLLQRAGICYDTWNVYSDWLYMFAAALSNGCDLSQREEREARYLQTIRKYDKETQELFPQMAAECTMALEEYQHDEGYHDVLGETFHALELHNRWMGQFFTPQHIADVCGMTVAGGEDMDDTIQGHGFVSVGEPACGSGVMLLGFLNAFRKLRPQGNPSREVLLYANDLDERCVCMAYIQLSLYGLPAVVQQKNTLTQECSATWFTPVYIWHGWRFKECQTQQIILDEQEALAMLDA